MGDRTCLEHDELKHCNADGYTYCVTCRRIELATAALREENERLRQALRVIADMACMEHDDDEHTEDCGVTVARAALAPKEDKEQT